MPAQGGPACRAASSSRRSPVSGGGTEHSRQWKPTYADSPGVGSSVPCEQVGRLASGGLRLRPLPDLLGVAVMRLIASEVKIWLESPPIVGLNFVEERG